MADNKPGPARRRRRYNKKKANQGPPPRQFGGEQPNNPPPPKPAERGKGKSTAAQGNDDAAEPPLDLEKLKALRRIVTSFVNSGEPKKALYNLTKEERSQVHHMALKSGLKTSSKGPANARVLTMTRPQPGSNDHEHLECPRMALDANQIKRLKLAQPHVELLLSKIGIRMIRREQNVQQSGNYARPPSNLGLVGRKLVPPEPRNRNQLMSQERRSLPIYSHRSKILSVMQRDQVLIIQGATGSGKSTQLPQYILESAAKHRMAVRIVVSQPRRIAAISVSERIAKERGESLGNTVGYQIRMNKKCSIHTVLSFTTSGCLLRAMAMEGKALLRNTTHLIIDEVHERDLDSDFLLLATKLELANNPHLRLVLMSATMDVDALSAYFGGATVLKVEGRNFGVRIFHLDEILTMTGYMTWQMEDYLGEVTERESTGELLAAYNHVRPDTDPDIDNSLIISLLELLMLKGDKGAAIVYLPGYYDMILLMEAMEACMPLEHIKIVLLHSQVENTDMRRAFQTYPDKMKVILSTNIGQTSITIPDLLFVVDAGRAKMKTHDAATDASQLATTWISKADAQQRTGRAGRLTNGICYRLYSTDRFAKMSEFSIPEIRRRPLDEICLLTKIAAPEKEIANFLAEALDPPQPEAVLQACSRLRMLGIIEDSDEQITPLGRIIAELPLGVQLAKCLILSVYYRCLGSVAIIAAYHSVRDPFVLSSDRNRKPNSQNSRNHFAGTSMSDSLAVLNLYDEYTNLHRRDVAKFCEDNSVCRHSMEMFISAVGNLRETVRRIFQLNNTIEGFICAYDSDMDMVRLTLTAGLSPKLAFVDKEKKCQLISGDDTCMQVSRSSCLVSKKKLFTDERDWLVYVEKTRNADQRSTLEHATMVSSLMVALVAGKNVRLEQRDSKMSQLCLDSWIRLSCPTDFGLQLLRLRELMGREVAELVETRRMSYAFYWLGPELVKKMLESSEPDGDDYEYDCDSD